MDELLKIILFWTLRPETSNKPETSRLFWTLRPETSNKPEISRLPKMEALFWTLRPKTSRRPEISRLPKMEALWWINKPERSRRPEISTLPWTDKLLRISRLFSVKRVLELLTFLPKIFLSILALLVLISLTPKNNWFLIIFWTCYLFILYNKKIKKNKK